MDDVEVKALASYQYEMIIKFLQELKYDRVPETIRFYPNREDKLDYPVGDAGLPLGGKFGAQGIDLNFLKDEKIASKAHASIYTADFPVYDVNIGELRRLATSERLSITKKNKSRIYGLPAIGEAIPKMPSVTKGGLG